MTERPRPDDRGAAHIDPGGGSAVEELADHLPYTVLGIANRVSVVANDDVPPVCEAECNLLAAGRRRHGIELAGQQQ